MDCIIGLPNYEGKSVIMAVVYRLTKYGHFCALSHPFKTNMVANYFMETIQKIHDTPNIVVSDRDPNFTGKFCMNYFLVWVLNWLIAHLITPNMMYKHR